MPKELHDQLDKRAKEMGLIKDSEAYRRYVYGTLNKIDRLKKRKRKR